MRKLALGFLSVGLVVGLICYWFCWRWPQGEITVEWQRAELRVDTPARVVLATNQPYSVSVRRDVQLQVQSEWLGCADIKRIALGDRLAFALEVKPKRPNVVEAVSCTLGPAGSVTKIGKQVRIAMPELFEKRAANFLEMADSPPENIYGAEIALWSRPANSDRVVVTGHAASSVCREVSAAIMRLATHADQEDPEFFVGAGLAVIHPNLTQQRVLSMVDSFRVAHPSVWRQLQGGRGLASLIEDEQARSTPVGKMLVAQELDLLRDSLKLLALDASKSIESVEAAELETYAALRKVSAGQLTPEQVKLINELLQDPRAGIALENANRLKAHSRLVDSVHELDSGQRAALARDATELYDLLTLASESDSELSTVESSTGLLHTEDGYASTVDRAARQKIADSLQKFAAASTTKGPTFLTEIAQGHRGVILAPYYSIAGKQLEFDLEQGLFTSGGEIAGFLKSSLQEEMASSARRATHRWKEATDEAKGVCERLASEAKASGSLAAWLRITTDHEFVIVDQFGRQTDRVERKSLSNLKFWMGRLEFAAEADRSAGAFRALADSFAGKQDDPRMRRIVEQCTVDSFLRGWQLSFIDASLEKQFERWIGDARDRVWEEMFRLAAAQGVDLRGVVREGTVFLVRTEGRRVRVQPCYVASLGTAAIVRDQAKGMYIYESSWSTRVSYAYDAKDWKEVSIDPSTLLQGNAQTFESAAQRAVAFLLSGAEAIDELPKSDQKIAEEAIVAKMRAVFAIEPEHAAQAFASKLLELWGDPGTAPSDRQVADAGLLQSASTDDDKKAIIDSVLAGEWSLPDQYAMLLLRLVDENDDETKRVGAELLEYAKQRDDAGYVEGVLKSGIYAPSRIGIAASTAFALAVFRDAVAELRALLAAAESGVNLEGKLHLSSDRLAELFKKAGLDASSIETSQARMAGLEKTIAGNHSPEALDKYLWSKETVEIAREVAQPLITQLQSLYSRTPSAAALQSLVDLTWISGQFRDAFTLLRRGVGQRVGAQDAKVNARYRVLDRIAEAIEREVIMGLVYTGGRLVDGKLFSRKITDFVLKPSDPTQVPRSLRFGYIAKGSKASQEIADAFSVAIKGKASELVGRKIGPMTIREVRESFTDARVLIVEGEDGLSVLKVRPNTAAHRAEARAAVEIADFLRRKGFDVPAPLPMGPKGPILEDGAIIVTRERLAPGRPLSELLDSKGLLTGELRDRYIDTCLDLAVKCADLPSQAASRQPVRTYAAMREKLLLRAELGKAHRQLFDGSGAHQSLLKDPNNASLADFGKRLDAFIRTAWLKKETGMQDVGFIHDAHLGNLLSGSGSGGGGPPVYRAISAPDPGGGVPRLVVIDVGDDYVGNVGHVFAMNMDAIHPEPVSLDVFRAELDLLLKRYEAKKGAPVTSLGKLEILRAMVLPPYNLISADSRRALGRLREALKISDIYDSQQIVSALQQPGTAAILDDYLGGPARVDRYRRNVIQLGHTLRLLREIEPGAAAKRAIDAMIEALDCVEKTGCRFQIGAEHRLQSPLQRWGAIDVACCTPRRTPTGGPAIVCGRSRDSWLRTRVPLAAA